MTVARPARLCHGSRTTLRRLNRTGAPVSPGGCAEIANEADITSRPFGLSPMKKFTPFLITAVVAIVAIAVVVRITTLKNLVFGTPTTSS